MVTTKTDSTEELGNPRQVRFQKGTEQEIEQIADANALDFPSAVRLAIGFGLPILKERLTKKKG